MSLSSPVFMFEKYLIGGKKSSVDKIFRWKKYSVQTRNIGSFVRRKCFIFICFGGHSKICHLPVGGGVLKNYQIMSNEVPSMCLNS